MYKGICIEGSPGGSVAKNPPAGQEPQEMGVPSRVGKIPWRRAWQPLQYSCRENPTDRGAWWATVHSVAKNWTWLKQLNAHKRVVQWLRFLPAYTGGPSSILGQGTRSHMLQLRVIWHNKRSHMAQRNSKNLQAVAKTWHSQVNK